MLKPMTRKPLACLILAALLAAAAAAGCEKTIKDVRSHETPAPLAAAQ
jgi:hypothetical protein